AGRLSWGAAHRTPAQERDYDRGWRANRDARAPDARSERRGRDSRSRASRPAGGTTAVGAVADHRALHAAPFFPADSQVVAKARAASVRVSDGADTGEARGWGVAPG